jgi:hypothetical protein
MQNYLRRLQIGCLLAFFTLTAFAQSPVTGKVVDERNEGIPGVTVSVKGKIRGTTTDATGTFTLEAAPSETLVFSYVGYGSQEIGVGNQTNFNVKLAPDIRNLDELVVVGYGTVEK